MAGERRGNKASCRGLVSRLAAGVPANRNAAIDVEAIVAHLSFLLNTRLGEAATAPDYGIEDLSDLTTTFPEAQEIWRASIRATIEKYEPRLSQVRVRHTASENPLVICFEIMARLTFDEKRGPLMLQTQTDSSGHFEIW